MASVRSTMNLIPITLLFTSDEVVHNATKRGELPGPPNKVFLPNEPVNVTYTFITAIVLMRYDGPATLNKYRYSMDCLSFVRCPVPLPATFQVTLLASERLFPVPLQTVVNVGTSIVSVLGSLTVSPTTVAQLGVMTSLKAMSRCTAMKLDDEDDNDSYEAFQSGTYNPFELSIGRDGGRRFIRAALATSVVYLLVLSMLMLAFTAASTRLPSWLASAQVVPSLGKGYPSALIAVASFGMDGLAAAGIILAVYGAGWTDRFFGCLAVGLCVAFVSHIVYVTTSCFPSKKSIRLEPLILTNSKVALSQEPFDREIEDRLLPSGSLLASTDSHDSILNPSEMQVEDHYRKLSVWLRRETDKWILVEKEEPAPVEQANTTTTISRSGFQASQPNGGGASAWMERHESYIADARLPWYCGLEQSVALLVCLLGSLSFASMPFCIVRGTVAALLLGVQALVMVVKRPLVHRWRWLLMSTILISQTSTAVLSVVNAPLQNLKVELAMDCINAAVFFLLGIATASDIIMLLIEVREAAQRVLAALRKRLQRRRKGLRGGNDIDHRMAIVLSDSLVTSYAPLLETANSTTNSNEEATDVNEADMVLPFSHIKAHAPLLESTTTATADVDEGDMVRLILRQLAEFEDKVSLRKLENNK
eukprot:GILI01017990.1.p1 GENE.GILI01017990.1~~GILI01017990.1.p1  ORF type:complete len:666 (-),score=81.69 GILI01017990.1:631-2577(-)